MMDPESLWCHLTYSSPYNHIKKMDVIGIIKKVNLCRKKSAGGGANRNRSIAPPTYIAYIATLSFLSINLSFLSICGRLPSWFSGRGKGERKARKESKDIAQTRLCFAQTRLCLVLVHTKVLSYHLAIHFSLIMTRTVPGHGAQYRSLRDA